MNVEKGHHFEAYGAAVANHVIGAPQECQPQDVVLVEELVKILVEEEYERSDQSGVEQVHF
jgi:hypothetical protein